MKFEAEDFGLETVGGRVQATTAWWKTGNVSLVERRVWIDSVELGRDAKA